MNLFKTRYSFGGDEFLFMELSEAFDLENIFKIFCIKKEIKEKKIEGIYDVCAGNASILIRFNPDVIVPDVIENQLRQIEESIVNYEDIVINSRLVEIPIFFNDPWTTETCMKFRDRHQSQTLTDIEYCAQINGFDSVESFVGAITGNPHLCINVGFVPGLPWCYQLVPKEKQIEVPKYLRPRTFTYERTYFYAGVVSGFYPAEGTGGAQIFGISATPVFDRQQKLLDFKDNIVFPKPGDIYNFRSITREEYDAIRIDVENGTFEYYKKDFQFVPKDVYAFEEFSTKVKRRLYND